MRIVDRGTDTLQDLIQACRRFQGEVQREIVDAFSDELRDATETVRFEAHVHEGTLKESIDSESHREGDHWQGAITTGDARGAHFEIERGAEHNFLRSVEDGRHFGEAFEFDLDEIFRRNS